MRYFPILVVILFLSGCVPYDMQNAPDGLPTVSSYTEAALWVDLNITYQLDSEQYGIREYWASPSEVLASRKGDCEDMAILYIEICKYSFGEIGEIRVQLVDGLGHGYAVVNGHTFHKNPDGVDTGGIITYEDYMWHLGDQDNYRGVDTTPMM